MTDTPPPTRPSDVAYGRLLIDGEWVEAASGDRLDVIDPATGQAFGSLAAGGGADIDAAVAAARRAFREDRWLRLPAAERGRILFRVADLLEARIDALAPLETRDNGMPILMARGLVLRAAEMFRYFGGWTTKVHGQTTEMNFAGQPMLAYTLREPVGVVGLIVPWNVPIVSAAQKLAVALAAGCTAVLKPAEEASLTALQLGVLMAEAGVPPGVVNIVTGAGEIAGAALADHADVDKISFTGSGEVGRAIIRASADTNLKRVTLELGGKSPVVVFDDADIAQAAAGAARGIFRNSGQVCAAGSRLYVHEAVYDAVVDGVAEAARSLRLGEGLDPSHDMGPLISAAHRERVRGLIASGLDDGAELIAGGGAPERPGYFLEPTILGAPPADARVVREEIFGPVVTVTPFRELEEVQALANDTHYGLAAAVWTRDVQRAHRMARALQAGMVWINCASVADAAVPFGGVKQSGWGREHGWEGVEAFLQTKAVFTPV